MCEIRATLGKKPQGNSGLINLHVCLLVVCVNLRALWWVEDKTLMSNLIW